MTTLQENSRQNSENHLLKFRKRWKSCPLSKKNYFWPKCSSEHAQRSYGKPAVTLLPRIRKVFPNSKNVEVTFCWTNSFFFIKNDSLATETAVLTTLARSFYWESPPLQLRFRKPRKKICIFRKENNFPKSGPIWK